MYKIKKIVVLKIRITPTEPCKVTIKVIAIVTIQWDMSLFPFLHCFYVKWKAKIVCLFCNCIFSFAKWSQVSGCEPEWPFGACERLCLWEVCEVFTWFLHQHTSRGWNHVKPVHWEETQTIGHIWTNLSLLSTEEVVQMKSRSCNIFVDSMVELIEKLPLAQIV